MVSLSLSPSHIHSSFDNIEITILNSNKKRSHNCSVYIILDPNIQKNVQAI
jgi:hypothetical protein